MKEPVPILQIVNQFAIGGAEGQFVARVRRHPAGFRPLVACIHKKGPNLAAVEELGLPVEEFGLRGSLAQLNTGHQILRLAAFIAREGVRLVHSNDFYANLLAVPAARKKNMGVVAMKATAQEKLLGSGAGKATIEELLRYSMSLPVAAVNIGMPSFEMVKQNVELARNFKPLSPQEIRTIQDKTAVARAGLESFFVRHSDTRTG